MSWSFARHSNPIAKKKHICECCGYVIPIGFKYSRIDGVFEGDFTSLKTHEECDKMFHKSMGLVIYADYEEVSAIDLIEIMTEAELSYEEHIKFIKDKYIEVINEEN